MNHARAGWLFLTLAGLFLAGCSVQAAGRFRPLGPPDSAAMLADVKKLAAVDDARLAGSAGETAAAAWTVDRLRSHGFEVSLQEFPIRAYMPERASVAVDAGPGQTALPLTFSPSTGPEGLDAGLVFAGLGRPEDFEGRDVAGKLVLVERGQIWFRVKVENAAARGALGCMIFDPAHEKLHATLDRPAAIPAVSIAGSLGRQLTARLAEGFQPQVRLICLGRTIDGHSRNVVASLPGLRRDEALVVGAHIDGTDTPAALDNASGVACLLELARRLAGEKPSVDLVFVLFGAEEIGLVGSRHFVANRPAASIGAMLNLDTVGSGDRFMLYTVKGPNALSELAGRMAAELGFAAAAAEADNSDHASFAAAGIPAVFLMREPEKRYHTDADNPSAVLAEALRDTVLLAEKIIRSWPPITP